LHVSAQKNTWSIGVYTGFRVEKSIYGASEYYNGRLTEPTAMGKSHVSIPPVELNVSYHITNGLSLKWGVAYVEYRPQRLSLDLGGRTVRLGVGSVELNERGYEFRYRPFKPFRFIQIPVLARYDFPFGKRGFSFFVQSGLVLDIYCLGKNWNQYSGDGSFEESFTVTFYDKTCLQQMRRLATVNMFNMQLTGGAGFAYRFPQGWQVSLSWDGYAGVSKGKQGSYILIENYYTGAVEYVLSETISVKDYWNIGLGVSYTFKRKIKE
jgi:hypothetical protein